MIKESIQWKGHNGQTMNKTLYFNLDRFEIAHDMELEVLEARFKKFQEDVVGPDPDLKRDMTPPEVRELLDIVKVMVKHAYGVRSADGIRFSKNEDIWNEFVEIGAFSAFIWYLFENPTRANAFLTNIWPEEVKEAVKVEEQRQMEDVNLPQAKESEMTKKWRANAPDDGVPSITSVAAADDGPSYSGSEVNGWVVKDHLGEYTDSELLGMPPGEFEAVMQKFKTGNNVPTKLLVLGFERTKGGETAE
jgi:hypothetical protein